MEKLKEKVINKASDLGVDVIGMAGASISNKTAPEGFSPEDQLPGSKTVVVFGKKVPQGTLKQSRDGGIGEHYYMRVCWTSGNLLDAAAYEIANLLEKDGYLSLPVPTYIPMRIHDGKPKGVISLKHHGQITGIGSIAKNSLLINSRYGNLFRLGGITWAPLPPDEPLVTDPCPEDCNTCVSACPVNAINPDDRAVDIMKCMGLGVRHPLLQPYFITKALFRLSKYSAGIHRIAEDISNMLALHHLESCTKCLRACRHFNVQGEA